MQPDHEGGADHRGDDLRHKARALGTDDAEQRHGEADRERGRSSPHGHDQPIGAHPAQTAAHDQNIDERRGERDRHRRDRDRNRGDAHGKQPLRGDRRRQDQIEIGARIERARHRFHGLRDHQQPRQQHTCGDRHQHRRVDRRVGVAADHPIGDEVHEDREDENRDHDAAQPLAPARGDHGQPVAPGEPRLVPREPDRGARCHAACACSATSARKVSSRLAPSLAPPLVRPA